MTDRDELERIREEKKKQIREQQQGNEQAAREEQMKEEAEKQKEMMLKKHLSDEARRRLNTVKMAKPEFGEEVENQLAGLIQSGRVQGQIDEDEMKQILKELQDDDDYDIKRV